MVVHHADGLHHRVTDRRAHEVKAAFAEVFAQGVGFGRARRDLLEGFPSVSDRLAADELPEIRVETAEFFLHSEEGFRVLDRRVDLEPVADDAGVSEKRLYFP